MSILHSWFAAWLSCPDCGSKLVCDPEIRCDHCGYRAGAAGGTGALDLRPSRPRPYTTTLHRTLAASPVDQLERIDTTPPPITYAGPRAIRDSSALMSLMCQHLQPGDPVLDLGCGPRDQAGPVTHLGWQYVGVDYSNPAADFLADAHAIPFQDNTFAAVLSYAVLEHLHTPIVALSEIQRVLKPGGIYIGTVSLGEPFHESYVHLTPWGLLALVDAVPGFRVLRLWSSGDTLGSLARMGRYPRVLKSALALLHQVHDRLPWLAPRRRRWSPKALSIDALYRAGSVCFLIQKL